MGARCKGALAPESRWCFRVVLQVLSVHAAFGCLHFGTYLCILVSVAETSILAAAALIHVAPVNYLDPVDGAYLATPTEQCLLAAVVLLLGITAVSVVGPRHGRKPLRKAFMSMRFHKGVPLPQMHLLKSVLKRYRVEAVIATHVSGIWIKRQTFKLIRDSDIFVVAGTNDFGVNTGHEASTYFELQELERLFRLGKKPQQLALIDMRREGERFKKGAASRLFRGSKRLFHSS